MSHWRRSHEPAPQHSYLADWIIAATVVLALVLIAGRVDFKWGAVHEWRWFRPNAAPRRPYPQGLC
jgi:hypothetical protein